MSQPVGSAARRGARCRGPLSARQAVSGYWHTPRTFGYYLRVRSYLTSAHGHGIRPLDAIRDLTGNPWLPATA